MSFSSSGFHVPVAETAHLLFLRGKIVCGITTTNILEQDIHQLLLPGFSKKIYNIVKYTIEFNTHLSQLKYSFQSCRLYIYNHSCNSKERNASFKPDKIIVAYKLLILYLNILAYKLKQLAHKTVAFACIMQVNKSLRKIIKTYIFQCFFKNQVTIKDVLLW